MYTKNYDSTNRMQFAYFNGTPAQYALRIYFNNAWSKWYDFADASYRYLLGNFDLAITQEIQTIELPSFSGYSRVIWVFREEVNNATYIAEIDASMFDQLTNLSYFFRFRDSQEFSINIIPGTREIRLFGDISVTIKLKKVYGAK